MRTRVLLTAVGIVLTLGLAGCLDDTNGPGHDCLCTTQFVQIIIAVVDAGGEPVQLAELEVTLVRTGETFDLSILPSDPSIGLYAIFTDSFLNRISWQYQGIGEELRVVGRMKDAEFTETYRVGVTDECRCHVRKISGPDTVVIH